MAAPTLACGECGGELLVRVPRCPECGATAFPARAERGMGRVGLVMVGTLGYSMVVVIVIWLADMGYLGWGVAWTVIGGIFAVIGAGMIWDMVHTIGRQHR